MMIPINLLHIFQLENYDIARFLKFAYSHFKFRFKGSKRQHLVWTHKAIILFLMANVTFLGVLLLGYCVLGVCYWLFVLLLVDLLLFPLLFVVSLLFIKPLEYLLEIRIINKPKMLFFITGLLYY